MKLWICLLFVFSSTIQAAQANSEPEIKFGPEFTFTNEEIVKAHEKDQFDRTDGAEWKNSSVSDRYLLQWMKLLQEITAKHCLQCKVVATNVAPMNKIIAFRLLFPDGWYMEVEGDPGVLEVRTNPMTLQQAAALKNRIHLIFQTAAMLQLKADPILGNGHVNISFAPFQNDPLLLRNFLVDYHNHPTLGFGSLGTDLFNAPPLALQSEKAKAAYYQLVNKFDEAYRNLKERSSQALNGLTMEFVDGMNKQVYAIASRAQKKEMNYMKFQAVNLQHLNPRIPLQEWRIEIRAHRPQRSAEEWLMLNLLYERKIKTLKILSARGVFVPLITPKNFGLEVEMGKHGAQLAGGERVRVIKELSNYVGTCGLKPEVFLQTFLQ